MAVFGPINCTTFQLFTFHLKLFSFLKSFSHPNMANPFHILLLFSTFYLFLQPSSSTTTTTTSNSIGVNYGTIADNLPPPSTVATFLKTQTTINRIKIFDTNPAILRAFANTNISVTVTVSNADIPSLKKLPSAQS
jgi:hypothetical protein